MATTLQGKHSAAEPRLSAFEPITEGIIKKWTPLALFSLLWADLIRLLSTQWEAREQYAYGWFVPLFASALFIRRWGDRPCPTRAVAPVWLKAAITVSVLTLLPLRIIYEINPDWPLVAWAYSLIVVVVSLFALFLAGGLGWTRHFLFPVAFILVAVVWPYRIEKGLTQDLMRVVASITVEILGWLDIPALQKGNLIDLPTGTLGVDEACSGIRSFQSSLMAALLMGELYRFRLWPRLLLIGSGISLGFCFNVVRTTLLSWQTSAHGLQALEKWHDPAGMTITVACFFCLWALAILIRKWTSHSESKPQERLAATFQPFPRRYLLACGLWSLICIGTTEVWYRSHTNPNSGKFYWTVALPETKPDFQKTELAPRTLHLLSFDQGATGAWTEEGMGWNANFFRWKPRSIGSVITSRIHRPEVCLTASGLRQRSESKLLWFDAGQFKLPFRKYTFESDEGRQCFVFFCQWEDGFKEQAGMQASNQAGRLKSVTNGRRLVGQQTLELILTGYPSLDTAEQAVRNRLPTLIRPDA
jgi:exosortase